MELLGAQSSAADAEVIGLVQEALDTLGVEQIRLFINSIGCPNCRPKFQQALKDYYSAHYDELCPTCQDRLERNPLRILDCKEEHCHELAEHAPIVLDYLCDECREHFEELQERLRAMGIAFEVRSHHCPGPGLLHQDGIRVQVSRPSAPRAPCAAADGMTAW